MSTFEDTHFSSCGIEGWTIATVTRRMGWPSSVMAPSKPERMSFSK